MELGANLSAARAGSTDRPSNLQDKPFSAEALLTSAAQGPWPAFKDQGALSPEASSFLRQLHDDSSPDELASLSLDGFLSFAHGFWEWSAQRSDSEQRTRLFTAQVGQSTRHVLEVVGPDMPFLVDSVMGAITETGGRVMLMAHPIVQVRRDETGLRVSKGAPRPESMIQVHLEPLSRTRAEALAENLHLTLLDVRAAVGDFGALKAAMTSCADELARATTTLPREEMEEAIAFLRWLANDNFTFLGARAYTFPRGPDGSLLPEEPDIIDNSSLGVLRDPERYVLRRANEPAIRAPALMSYLNEPNPLIVAKSTLMSRVHRRAPADYIGVKRYDGAGTVIGETRFVGLFTADAYNEMTRDIPLLRRKAQKVMAASGFVAGSHNEKVLRNILETYPRDELFQTTEGELRDTALGILHLFDRPRPRVFSRRDRFNRFVSVLAFLPKDRFNSALRIAVGNRLCEAYGGEVQSFYPVVSDAPLARIHYILSDIDAARPDPDMRALDADVAALTRTWEDGFEAALNDDTSASDDQRRTMFEAYSGAFTAAYRERFSAMEALVDIRALTTNPDAAVHVRAYRLPTDADTSLRAKIYVGGGPLPLSQVLPILENMGLFVDEEVNFAVRAKVDDAAAAPVWIHDVVTRAADGKPIDLAGVERTFSAAFAAIWTGQADNDRFNRLILKLGISWREAALIRALARYRQQTGLDPSQPVQEAALADHPDITAQILGLFRVRFDPSLSEPIADRAAWANRIEAQIEQGLAAVTSLDADRALRRLAKLVAAIQRTNYYQTSPQGTDKPYFSFKIASRELTDLPNPKPYREIWVSGPDVEGVHLRFGPVARGGLRWSDRRDDFRTEVLDLVKAQQVKNAIIVPVGAKGGFFPKKLPARGAPGFQEAGIAAYKTFLRGLLDITDNLDGDTVIAPQSVVRWDGDDPYLVVAADKGTATFSDIANGISEEYGHWLGDAFASGGSAGYDHKDMGITAKGAWEAVKRHFRELGHNTQTQPFTVIGVGDMSGDVFGNGMLLSDQIQLVAAFDHRDIFIDPTPDTARSFAERQRLFALPRSSWRDYDASLISPGGGVFSRNEKAIVLSPEIKALTGLQAASATPTELMHALLKAPCDLLWFGGIGTFIKASDQSHADAGDKSNDAVRVDAAEVQAKVIGEGANLGVTQAGRIEFAARGGRINTDAVDNSAGVDTSDHEVNIKILLADALRAGVLTTEQRAPLLADMTEEVGRLVLADNYDQTLALTLTQATAARDLDSHERLIERLEQSGKLDRTVEGLPAAEGLRALREQNRGLTRPELAKLLAYAKIDLFDALVASTVPDDPYFTAALVSYFPSQLQPMAKLMQTHRLKREIIATGLADDLVNVGGPSFVERVRETARAEPAQIAAAFEAARAIFRLDTLVARINALDTLVPAEQQTQLHLDIATAARRMTIYLVRRGQIGTGEGQRGIGAAIEAYRPAVDAQAAIAWQTLTPLERSRAEARRDQAIAGGTPEDLAGDIALLPPMMAALDVADVAARRAWPVPATTYLYRALGTRFAFDQLRAAAQDFVLDQHWDRLAMRRTVEELYEDQRALTEQIMARSDAPPAEPNQDWAVATVDRWVGTLGARAGLATASIEELRTTGGWTFAKVVIAAAELRSLAAG